MILKQALLTLCTIVVLNCSNARVHDVIMDEPVERFYPLRDAKGMMHEYRNNFDKMIFPKHNVALTQYCTIHRHWEDIKPQWSKNGGDYYRWQYNVKKNSKRFK